MLPYGSWSISKAKMGCSPLGCLVKGCLVRGFDPQSPFGHWGSLRTPRLKPLKQCCCFESTHASKQKAAWLKWLWVGWLVCLIAWLIG